MAQTTKNSNTTKKTAAKSGSTAKKTTSSAKKSTKKVTQKQAAELLAQRRCILAAVLLCISFVGVLHMFHTGGFLVKGYQGVFYWLLGWGAEVLPLCLLVCAVLLVIKRRKRCGCRA